MFILLSARYRIYIVFEIQKIPPAPFIKRELPNLILKCD